MAFEKANEKIDELIHSLSETLKMTDLDIVTKFLGIKMNSLRNLDVSVSQAPLANELLRQTAMQDTRAVETSVGASIAYRDLPE